MNFSGHVFFDQGANAVKCGDSDVATLANGNVVVTDLNVTHATVQVSTNFGQSFPNSTCVPVPGVGVCTNAATAPEDDRPWLTAQGTSTVYVAYHDFVLEVPIVCTSIDGGSTFSSCFQAYGASTSAQGNTGTSNCQENTIPSRSLQVDPTDGSLNFMYACSSTLKNAQDPPYGPLYQFFLAHAAAVVNGVAPAYLTRTVYSPTPPTGTSPNYSNIFSSFRIDSQGNYYAVFDGTADDNNVLANPYHVYLTVSKDKGINWTSPVEVDQPADPSNPGTNVFADFSVTTPGNVDIAWYHSPFTGEPNGVCGGTVQNTIGNTGCTQQQSPFTPAPNANAPGWNVYMAQSVNALCNAGPIPTCQKPLFTNVEVNANATHYGEICTNGIVCGSSDRSLLDFLSIGVDCNGAAHIAYPANASTTVGTNSGTDDVYVANQTSGSFIAPPASCSVLATAAPEAPLAVGLIIAGGAGIPVAVGLRRLALRRSKKSHSIG
jgi:hypothetical protein